MFPNDDSDDGDDDGNGDDGDHPEFQTRVLRSSPACNFSPGPSGRV